MACILDILDGSNTFFFFWSREIKNIIWGYFNFVGNSFRAHRGVCQLRIKGAGFVQNVVWGIHKMFKITEIKHW